jgi:hypothetical protein
MLDLYTLQDQTVIRVPHDATVTRRDGKKHVEVHDPRTSVTMPTPGGELTLFFDPPLADGALNEVRLIPGPEPWRLMSRLPLYLSYARAVAAWRQDDKVAALRALRDVGSGVRGHGDDFYRGVASMYNALVAAGEPSPIKAIAESQPVSISAASKWVTRARNLGFIEPKKEGKADAS